ncbi:hypothetical protein DEO72_LG4g295 [Vigna unguiculata]|uniref:Uncharacterized protein n=1 Tax=Vigna unguiculata TaxID=3917 RepID=A0A4D6LL90_VIGUN|nr:hypothetical protein DEO72_LG4g295 [Vigna unguiculata]
MEVFYRWVPDGDFIRVGQTSRTVSNMPSKILDKLDNLSDFNWAECVNTFLVGALSRGYKVVREKQNSRSLNIVGYVVVWPLVKIKTVNIESIFEKAMELAAEYFGSGHADPPTPKGYDLNEVGGSPSKQNKYEQVEEKNVHANNYMYKEKRLIGRVNRVIFIPLFTNLKHLLWLLVGDKNQDKASFELLVDDLLQQPNL